MSVKTGLKQLATDAKFGATISTATAGSSLGYYLDFIPDNIAKLTVLIGALGTITVIYFTIKRYKMDKEKSQRDAELHAINMRIKQQEAQLNARKLGDID